MTAEEKTCL